MAASNYDRCLAKVLHYEGGYVNHPSDPGGPTNYGITIKVARENSYSGPMQTMPLDVAKRIYRAKYWDAAGCDGLPAGLDLAVFDLAVNSGVARARSMLATSGASGTSGTVAERVDRLCDARLDFLKRLKTWSVFGKGWGSRVADVRATAKAMAAQLLPQAPTPLPMPPTLPTTAPAVKQAGWLTTAIGVVTAAWHQAIGSGTVRVFAFALVAAALYWFLVRPVLIRFTALGDLETDTLTKLRLALKGIKTQLWAWLLGIAGIALPVLGYVNDFDLTTLPDIGGVPASLYSWVILAVVGWVTKMLRNATTTPVGQTDLALASPPPAPVVAELPAPELGDPMPREAVEITTVRPRRRRKAKAGRARPSIKAKKKKRKAA